MTMGRLFGTALAVALLVTVGCTMVTSPVTNIGNLREVDFTKQLKRGEACVLLLFGAIPVEGDASVVSAAQKGQIRRVEVVDLQYKNYVLFAKYCVIVYGS